MTYAERIWTGASFPDVGILVLGESWYGDYDGDLVTNAGYIAGYLEGRQTDRMYTKMANASGLGKQAFWRSVSFTNFVQRIGATPDCRPKSLDYRKAGARLERVLQDLSPKGVWILGIEQGAYSAPVVRDAGIAYEVSPHPTGVGITNLVLGAGWKALHTRTQQSRASADA